MREQCKEGWNQSLDKLKESLASRALVEGEESGTANYSLEELIEEIDNEGIN